jgi:hypothetical protein
MTGGSQNLRMYRRARRDGMNRVVAAELSGIALGEAKLIDADDAKFPPSPEAYELLRVEPLQPAEASAHEEEKTPMPEQEILTTHAAQSRRETERAIDGGLVPGPAMTGGQLIDQIGDGELGAELHVKAVDLAAAMNEVGNRTGNKAKGSLTLKIDFERDGDSFKVAYDIKAKKPEVPKPRTTMFCDEHNRFSRFPAGQAQFFGMQRAGEGPGGIRSVG